ncbi:threonine--tRNA ligase [Candidatus Desantisbacteria bacterium CG_4_10_14_0_8_um_filter_48_22]|uniref:Threonine--tRNA ligase n=1 Tax=Candidatus Desantisbacteria bacterium CG_4_10_14_0_8_um_filter_48_22 TaxID=1974543 RepID=A0A2M7SE33_9BACT|nr:MAG: threonine--tRNA ligase [Candidatus Desantisbacteria bacterium CG1_02_49_89]PIV57468.1 MAG: threonine--tRNA ligase [Candidatus Desantisbacteria bacterium CG02_land_8_20_14_3_00_49_13]PIZ17749.1 MAG: threonine--tRNA ligase [Candidatus Desantisbacteria bacterium CG_4_10_14_0_8_um_filter_48_22]
MSKERYPLDVYRHSASHILAYAVKELFPGVKFGIGPSIEDGFYYDFDRQDPFATEDLVKIEEKMREIINADSIFEKIEVDRKEAEKNLKDAGAAYKLDLLAEIPGQKVTFYKCGDFSDMCRGPHVPSTGEIKAFKLLSVAGAYWRGSEKNPMLQRIYGTAFYSQKELDEYIQRLEEIKKRDHRKLGKELDLFSIHQEEAGPGLIYWHPKGALIRRIIENFWVETHLKNGYDLIYSPHIARTGLWKTSGHLNFYKENMYPPMEFENESYMLKPMNCPGHIMVYKTQTRSYRDLPLRWAEMGTVYRYEKPGVLHGLLRVRGFTQDDAHIFCRKDQIEDEVSGVLKLTSFFLGKFGFKDYVMYVSTRPEKYVGTLENWEVATSALKTALEKNETKYQIDPGEGVFYGPKIDIKIKDALNREWQCTTIQVDFNLPAAFKLSYVGEDSKEHEPIMIHRAILGSFERFMAILIEFYNGAFPLWLAPVQVKLIPIADRHNEYSRKVKETLAEKGARVAIDEDNQTLQAKIRLAQMEKVPYMLVIGDKEVSENTVSVRSQKGGNAGAIKIEEFVGKFEGELKE